MFDNVLELLVLGGRSLPHAMMMMIPEATAGTRRSAAGAARVLRLPPVPDGGLGRPRRGVVHRRARDRRRRSTATACGPVAGSRRATAGSCSPPRPACSTSLPRTSSARAGCSRASSSSSISSRDASSRTTRSSARSPPGSRTREWFDREVVRLADLPPRMPHALPTESAAPAADRVRLLARGHEGDPRAAGAQRRGGGQLDGQRHAARGALRPRTGSSTRTSSSCSRRSRTRRSTRSARRS